MFHIDKPLHELIESMSYREFMMRTAWINLQMEEPSRADHYIMQLTGIVDHLLDKRPQKWQPDKYRLKFKSTVTSMISVPQRTALAKARWSQMAARGLADFSPRR